MANDHTIALFGYTVSLPTLPARLNLAGRRVALRHRRDGRLAVVYQGHCWACYNRRSSARHSWKRSYRLPSISLSSGFRCHH